VQSHCLAHKDGIVAELPEKRTKARLIAQTWLCAVVSRAGRLLVRQRPPSGLLQGMWEFPTFEAPAGLAAGGAAAHLRAQLRDRFGVAFRVGAELPTHRQVISNRKVTQRVFAATATGALDGAVRWLDDAAIERLAITTATRRILARLRAVTGAGASRPARARTRARSTCR
jgi:A/G-specific adenine glycosylase